MRASICVLSISLGVSGCYYGATSYEARESVSADLPSAPRHGSVMRTRRAGAARWSSDDLEDLGGPVIADGTMIAIWWGQTARFPSDAISGMDVFLTGLDGSRYLAVADQYVRGAKSQAKFLGHILETSAAPTHSPSTEEIVAKVCQVLDDARQVPNPNTMYLVFTDGFPEQADFCAWHDGGQCPNGKKIRVAYLPNMANAPQCDPGDLLSCNQFSEPTRALANVTAHEVLEMVTDPDGNGWLDRAGEEVADKCAWKFGTCTTLGSTRWQLQKEWSNADHACVQDKASAAPRVASTR